MFIQPNNEIFNPESNDGYRIRVTTINTTFTIDEDDSKLMETDGIIPFREALNFINKSPLSILGLNAEEFGELTDRLFRRLNLTLWVLGIASMGTAVVISIIKAFAIGVKTFPGVISLDPTSQDTATLNKYGPTLAKDYVYIRANYDSPIKVIRWLEQIYWDSASFQNQGNDLIVPYTGAGIEPSYLAGKVSRIEGWSYGTNRTALRKVHHVNFFEQDKVKSEIEASLKV